MNQTTPAPMSLATAIDYRGYQYTITFQHDAEGYAYPIYWLGSQSYVSLAHLKRDVDHLVNQTKLGRRDEEGLI